MPYVLFGHSHGALLAFEVARQLRRLGHAEPRCLIVSACRAPHRQRLLPPIHDLPVDAFLRELRCLGGTPEEVLCSAELMEIMLPALRADFAANENYLYRPDRPLACPIFAYGGAEDQIVSEQELASWRDQTTAVFVIRAFPGDHFFLRPSRALLIRSMVTDIEGCSVPAALESFSREIHG